VKNDQPKRKHGLEFKAEAMTLVVRTAAVKAAAQLSISPSQTYDWRITMHYRLKPSTASH
jgi:transposase-like protein